MIRACIHTHRKLKLHIVDGWCCFVKPSLMNDSVYITHTHTHHKLKLKLKLLCPIYTHRKLKLKFNLLLSCTDETERAHPGRANAGGARVWSGEIPGGVPKGGGGKGGGELSFFILFFFGVVFGLLCDEKKWHAASRRNYLMILFPKSSCKRGREARERGGAGGGRELWCEWLLLFVPIWCGLKNASVCLSAGA